MQNFSVTIRKIEKPFEEDFEKRLEWILKSLGVGEKAAKDYARMVFSIIEAQRVGKPIGSLSISEGTGKKRGAAIYHLNKLCAMGFIVRKGRSYVLRAGNLSRTVKEIFKDIERVFEDLEGVAKEIDKYLGLPG